LIKHYIREYLEGTWFRVESIQYIKYTWITKKGPHGPTRKVLKRTQLKTLGLVRTRKHK